MTDFSKYRKMNNYRALTVEKINGMTHVKCFDEGKGVCKYVRGLYNLRLKRTNGGEEGWDSLFYVQT